MSTLTKILIVLLSLFSLFLCGIIVTYVGSATNYKTEYQQQQASLQQANSSVTTLSAQLEKKTTELQSTQDGSAAQIQTLKDQNTKMESELRDARRENASSQERINNWAGVVKGLNETIANLEQSLKQTRSELESLRAEQVKDKKSFNELTTAIDEKTAQIQALETERRRLMEQKTGALESFAAGITEETAAGQPVTPPTAGGVKIRNAAAAEDIPLEGLVTAVDTQNSLATVSIGSADGVKKGMRFHVTRGEIFICDLVITNVDADDAAGTLDLVQQTPSVGDHAATKL